MRDRPIRPLERENREPLRPAEVEGLALASWRVANVPARPTCLGHAILKHIRGPPPNARRLLIRGSLVAISVTALFALQATFRQFPGMEDDPVPVPPDAYEKTEWAFTRLMYPSGRHASVFGQIGSWPTDYPKADRQFVQGVRRLTRIHTRSSEQVVDLDGDEVFNWPWLYAVEVGHWSLTDAECVQMREYLLRGRSEEHTSELQSLRHLVCRLLL